jgi:hypothetical protein
MCICKLSIPYELVCLLHLARSSFFLFCFLILWETLRIIPIRGALVSLPLSQKSHIWAFSFTNLDIPCWSTGYPGLLDSRLFKTSVSFDSQTVDEWQMTHRISLCRLSKPFHMSALSKLKLSFMSPYTSIKLIFKFRFLTYSPTGGKWALPLIKGLCLPSLPLAGALFPEVKQC